MTLEILANDRAVVTLAKGRRIDLQWLDPHRLRITYSCQTRAGVTEPLLELSTLQAAASLYLRSPVILTDDGNHVYRYRLDV